MSTIDNEHLTILVVDSDEHSRRVASDTLKAEGFNTVEARTSDKALMYFIQFQPEVVIINGSLESMNGYELCKSIRSTQGGSHVPLMVMIHRDDSESMTRLFDAGATDFITKPLTPFILTQRTRYLIRAHQTLKNLERREHLLEQAERIAKIGSWAWDSKTEKLYVSKECNRILGFDENHATTINEVLQRAPESERMKIIKYFRQANSKHQGTITLQHRLLDIHGMGQVIRHEAQFCLNNETDYTIYGTLHDITEEIAHKDQILHLAYYDSLTDLPNRTFFKAHLEHAVKLARKTNKPLAILVLDLDLFARINNSLGYDAGDELLKKVSKRLLQCLPAEDCTALNMAAIDPQAPVEPMTDKFTRIESDQFALLIHQFSTLDDVIKIAQRLFKQLATSFTLRGNNVVLTASGGIALYPVNGQGAEMLIRNADAAMHFAKSQGRNSFQFYSSDIDFKSKERLSMESDLRHAIRHNELDLHFQPKLHLKNRTIRSAEALVRWQHPTKGLISPSQFIPMAEELGLINELGLWLINQACAQARIWNDEGLPPIRVAVNLSPIQIKSATIVDDIRRILTKNHLPPSQMEVEITETVLLEDTNRVIRTLGDIHKLGVKVALDDFGTGYSALSYLTRFPFNTLKIDRAFVSDCVKEGHAAVVVHTIIQLCKNLNLEVVAEGVETEEELRFLAQHRCDLIQGFYFSDALTARQFSEYLQNEPWIAQLDALQL